MPPLKILVPFEDNVAGRRAIEMALGYAETHACEVFLFSVGSAKQFGKLAGDDLTTAVNDAIGVMRKALTTVIVKMSRVRPLDLKRIGHVHHRFTVGQTEKEILRMAGAISVGIIVIGVPTAIDTDFEATPCTFTPDFVANLVKKAPCNVFAIKARDPTFVVL